MPENGLLLAILAAGASRRLGTPKQLVPIDGMPLARRQCRIALAANVGPVAIVVGARAAEVIAAVADLAVEICMNLDWEEGMAASLRRAALAARMSGAGALLVLAGDQYRITADDLRRLHGAWRDAGGGACVSRAGEYLGPPAILPADRYEALLRLRGDVGARPVLFDQTRSRPLEVDSPRAMFDLDYPCDVKASRG